MQGGARVLATTAGETGSVVYPVRCNGAIVCFLANPHPWPLEVRLTGPNAAVRDLRIPGLGHHRVKLD